MNLFTKDEILGGSGDYTGLRSVHGMGKQSGKNFFNKKKIVMGTATTCPQK